MHGYEIMNEITRITNGEITVGAGSLYTLLPKFEKECYIQLVKVENNDMIHRLFNLLKTSSITSFSTNEISLNDIFIDKVGSKYEE